MTPTAGCTASKTHPFHECVSNEKQCVRARFIANGCGEFEACCDLDDDEQGEFQLVNEEKKQRQRRPGQSCRPTWGEQQLYKCHVSGHQGNPEK